MNRHIHYHLGSANLGRLPKGVRGDAGVIGATGVRGATGVEGATGIQGATGAKGFTGSEGPTGIAGTGVKGPTGVQGDLGIQGDTGMAGSKGDTGPRGAQGDSDPTIFSSKNYISSISTSRLIINNIGMVDGILDFSNSKIVTIKNLGNGVLKSFNINTTATNTTTNITYDFWIAAGSGNSSSNTMIYSTDGSNWNNANNGIIGSSGRGVAYGNGLWVAVGSGEASTNTIIYSSNGSDWYNANSDGFYTDNRNVGNGIAYGSSGTIGGDPLWVAVGEGTSESNAIKTSSNGSDWNSATSGGFDKYDSYIGYGIAYGSLNGSPMWVAVGAGSQSKNSIIRSINGSDWTTVNQNNGFIDEAINCIGYGVAYGHNKWVAVGSSLSNNILYSSDSSTWNNTTGDYFKGNIGYGVAYGLSGVQPLWVAVGVGDQTSNSIIYSSDGINWCNANNGFDSKVGYNVAYGNGLWTACGKGSSTSNTMLYSSDGSNWSNVENSIFSNNYAYGVAYAPKTIAKLTTSKPVININSNISLNLVNNNFSITSFSSTLIFTPKLMSTLQGMS